MAVAKEELAGSPTITFSRKGGSAKQSWRIAWEDQDNFAREVFPSPYVAGAQIIIPKAASYPGKFWYIAETMEIAPFDEQSPQGLFDVPNYYPTGARATVNYKTPTFDQTGNANDGPGNAIAFVKHKVRISGEFLTWPNQCLQWDAPSDPTLDTSPGATTFAAMPRDYAVPEDTQCSVVIPLIEHEMSWQQVAFPPWLAIRQCIGKVNAYPFAGAPAETLLFLGADGDREITSEGIRCWQINYKFAEKNQNAINPARPQGWNFFLRPNGPSAGQFMRMRKRLPTGSTRTTFDELSGANPVRVRSAAGFPRGAAFTIAMDGFDYSVAATNGSRDWTLTPPVVDPIPAGTSIVQTFTTTLAANQLKTATTLSVADRTPFPLSGQFLLQVDDEVMAVIGGHGAGAGVFTVLRGIQGTAVVQHASGATARAVAGNIYDLADFRVLFLSGLITG